MKATLLLLALVMAGCARESQSADSPFADVQGLEGEGDARALLYYAGGLASPEAADPLEAGVLTRSGSSYALNVERLPPGFWQEVTPDERALEVDWQTQVKPAFERTYAAVRGVPPTLAALQEEVGTWSDGDPAWFVHEVDGVMTAARRRLFVPAAAARAAAQAMAAGETAAYPVGTAVVGEHWLDGHLVETTVKRRRGDGHWDFAVYDATGALADGTHTPPRPLAAPAKCLGCHLGQKLHQPEKAFPASAPAGPDGPRAVHVPDAWRAATEAQSLALRFHEHARRADGVLGLYGTLYAARTLARHRAGDLLTPEDSALAHLLLAPTGDR